MTDGTAVSSPAAALEGEGRSTHRLRQVVAWVLVVLVSLLVSLSVVTVWSVRILSNTDHYVATMAPIARNATITNAIANRATTYLFDQGDATEKIAGVLPMRASSLAPVISDGLRTYTYRTVAQVLQSGRFADLWDAANRRLHTHLVDFLTGKKLPRVEQARSIAVNLTPVLIMAIDTLDAHGITTFDPVKSHLQKGRELSFTLANNAQVRKARSAFRLANEIGWALPLITVGLAVAGVAIAVNRRKMLVRLAAGASIVLVLFIAALALARSFFVDHAGNVDPSVTRSLWDIVIRYLKDDFYAILLISLLVLLAALLAGLSWWAMAARRGAIGGIGWAGSKLAALRPKSSGEMAPRWVTGVVVHSTLLRAGGLIVAGGVIVLGGSLSVTEVWVTVLVLAAYLVLLECLFAWARRIRTSVAEGTSSGSEVAGTDSVPRP